MDMVMLSQMWFYRNAIARDTPAGTRAKLDACLQERSESQQGSESGGGVGAGGCAAAVLCTVGVLTIATNPGLAPMGASRLLLGDGCAATASQAQHVTGTVLDCAGLWLRCLKVLGWASATIYLNSRLPQVIMSA